ncbi:MAG: hypothetical protein MUO31_04760 [Thermodesulfovibrionales bacterium]|nr:hypothetical protein [Thermodesulfovibrionales bacterium]
MKNKNIIILVLGCMLLSVSCNSGLTNKEAKEAFLKLNPWAKSVNTILLKQIGNDSYIARINYTNSSGSSYEFEYTFTKWDTGWTCAKSDLPYDPERWK